MREHLGEDFELEHPNRNLEQFFMEVIQEARESGQEASGAKSGGRNVAAYLEDDDPEQQQRNNVLEALTQDEAPAPVPDKTPAPPQAPIEKTDILEALTEPAAVPTPAETPPPSAAPESEIAVDTKDAADIDAKLKDLLGDQSDG